MVEDFKFRGESELFPLTFPTEWLFNPKKMKNEQDKRGENVKRNEGEWGLKWREN